MTNVIEQKCAVMPNSILAQSVPYAPPKSGGKIDLRLDRNEGPPCDVALQEFMRSMDSETMRRYPETREVEALLAKRVGLDSSRVLLTNGGDDAIERCCRVVLEPGRELLLPVPTFEMIDKRAALCGSNITELEWGTNLFPIEELLSRVGPTTSMIAIVSPNNPVGATISIQDIEKIATSK